MLSSCTNIKQVVGAATRPELCYAISCSHGCKEGLRPPYPNHVTAQGEKLAMGKWFDGRATGTEGHWTGRSHFGRPGYGGSASVNIRFSSRLHIHICLHVYNVLRTHLTTCMCTSLAFCFQHATNQHKWRYPIIKHYHDAWHRMSMETRKCETKLIQCHTTAVQIISVIHDYAVIRFVTFLQSTLEERSISVAKIYFV